MNRKSIRWIATLALVLTVTFMNVPAWAASTAGMVLATHFVDTGKQWVVDKLDDSSASTMNRVGWGTGAGTTGETDTTLFTEAAETRATGTVTQETTTVTGDTYQVVGTITATGTKTITNAALFDSVAGGTDIMSIKGDFTGIPLLANDSIEFTITLHVDQ